MRESVIASGRGKGLPGLRGVDHIGITVPDIEQATEFFVEAIGCEVMYAHGPRQDNPQGTAMQARLGVPPHSSISDIRALRCANGPNLELFEFHSPKQRTAYPCPSDHAIQHLALYVDDLDAAVEHLRHRGCRILAGPNPLPGPEEGPANRFIYTQTPWGMTLELISYPGEMAYQEHSEARRWTPTASDVEADGGQRVTPLE